MYVEIVIYPIYLQHTVVLFWYLNIQNYSQRAANIKTSINSKCAELAKRRRLINRRWHHITPLSLFSLALWFTFDLPVNLSLVYLLLHHLWFTYYSISVLSVTSLSLVNLLLPHHLAALVECDAGQSCTHSSCTDPSSQSFCRHISPDSSAWSSQLCRRGVNTF